MVLASKWQQFEDMPMSAFKPKNGDMVVWSDTPPGAYARKDLEQSYGKGPHELYDVGQTHARIKGGSSTLFSFEFFQPAPKANQ